MTAQRGGNDATGTLLAHSGAPPLLLPEAVWRGVIATRAMPLTEAVPLLEVATIPEVEIPASDPSADSLPPLNAPTSTLPSPALNNVEEAAAQGLFRRLRDVTQPLAPDERAALRDHLVLLHTPLVEHCARSLAVAGEALEDLMQEGHIGLIKAVDRFNPDKGARFSTYAYHLISGEIRHYLRDLGKLIHEPGWHSELRQRVNRSSEELTQQLGRLPGSDEVAAALNLPAATVHEVLRRHQSLIVESLDNVASEPGVDNLPRSWQREASALGLQPAVAPVEELVDNRLLVRQVLPRLSDLERRAVELFFYAERSKTEIARELGISVNYAAYLVKRGLKHLRQMLEEPEPLPASPAVPRPRRPVLRIRPKKTLPQPIAQPKLTQELVPEIYKPALKIGDGSKPSDNGTTQFDDAIKRALPRSSWRPSMPRAARHLEVPAAYRNDVVALPEFAHWLREEVGRLALSTPELCLAWYQVRDGYNTLIRLDTVPAVEALNAAQSLARRYGRNVDAIKRPASDVAARFYFCVAASDHGSDEDILLITSPANFARYANSL